MPLWRNVARLYNAIAGQGVTDPGPTDLLGPIQTTQVIDDVSHTVSPVTVPLSGQGSATGAVVGEFSYVSIQAGPRGALLVGTAGSPTNVDLRMTIEPTHAFSTTRTVLALPYASGPPLQSVVASGSRAVNASNVAPKYRLSAAMSYPNIWIPAGEIWCLTYGTANLSMAVTLLVQEPLA